MDAMKHTSITLLTLTAAAGFAQSAPASSSAFAVSGNVALTSNYVFRGVTQTNNHAAIQGGFDLTKTPISGLTAGVWASNVDTGAKAGTEADLYANYGFKVSAVDVNVGYIDYTYSASSGLKTGAEANISGTYAGVTLKVSKGVSGGLSDYYYEANYSREISQIKGLSFGLHYGNDRASKKDDYAVSLNYPIAGLDTSVSYTDLEKGKSITAFTVKKSF